MTLAPELVDRAGSAPDLMDGEQPVPWPQIPPVTLPSRLHENEHMALWQVRGTAEIRCGEIVVSLHEGQMLWIPAGTWHTVQLRANSVIFPFEFPAATTPDALAEVTVVQVGDEEKLVLLALYQSESTMLRPPTDIRRHVLAALERSRSGVRAPVLPRNPAAQTVALALLRDPGDVRRVVDWASAVHISARSLERAFKAETGQTFQAWRTACRMAAALRLLRSGISVTAVAHRVGYDSPSSFARAFRAVHGHPPSWLRGLGAGPAPTGGPVTAEAAPGRGRPSRC